LTIQKLDDTFEFVRNSVRKKDKPNLASLQVGFCGLRQPFGENAIRAIFVVTEKPARSQPNAHRNAIPRQIGQSSLVITMDTAGWLGTTGTGRCLANRTQYHHNVVGS
jgi:hypothetical protein